ncbi:MAG: allophanate hydrolase subunit 1 [Fimbriimonadaceae bacterium]|nr:allophanate hydrolase subunit 1 [Fimbriimonadaceae bacterium]
MRVQRLGESAWIVSELGDQPAYVIAAALRTLRLDGIVDVVPSYATVGIYTDRRILTQQDVERFIEDAAEASHESVRQHSIPVCYELGIDLAEVASKLDTSAESVIHYHLSVSYLCYAVGFCPGFPFLGYLPENLRGLGRRPSPRTRIEPGSVAIANGQTGIYPLERPGGWWLLGRTPLTIVDVDDDYFPITAGDQVQFKRIDEAEFSRLQGERL